MVAPRASENSGSSELTAVLWMQRAAEFRASARQAYTLAGIRLDEALADPSWTAALEQPDSPAEAPPAVIVDVDETVLDNSAYLAWLEREGQVFAADTWAAWCEDARAPAVPGALAFAKQADAKGVTIFYVTNRGADLEDCTRRNLRARGFPLRDDVDTVLTRNERPNWGGDKGTRRRAVAETHRIVLLVGDNLGDFMDGAAAPFEQRDHGVEPHEARFGVEWIQLPNAIYGSWDPRNDAGRLRALVPWTGPKTRQ